MACAVSEEPASLTVLTGFALEIVGWGEPDAGDRAEVQGTEPQEAVRKNG